MVLSSNADRKRSRLPQFGLLALLAVVAVLSAVLATATHGPNKQRRAVERLRALGAQVEYDTEGKGPPSTAPLENHWAHEPVGQDFAATADYVLLKGEVRDEDLQVLEDLPNLRLLIFDECSATENAVAYLKNSTKLRVVVLAGPSATDKSIRYLKHNSELATLIAGVPTGGHLTDDGLVTLEGMKSLKLLILGSRRITDAGLQHLEALTSLKFVILVGTQVTEDGIARLQAAGVALYGVSRLDDMPIR